tara:strand:- start:738 stop:998 length:261 start_codon:yes stop_codon:yes gene_type:complete
MKGTPFKLKQKLSPLAAKKKADRDLTAAKSPYRRAAKADSQKKHRDSPVNKNKDYDHKSGSFKSVKANRGNDGKGTRIEGKSKYKI